MKAIGIKGLGLFLLLAAAACNLSSNEEKAPPNIILFLVDDLGWQDTSVPFWEQMTPYNKSYRTPNMERLAHAGVKFTQAYATPVCSPTRVSLMTGMNAARHRVTNWTLRPDQQQPMERDHKTLEFPEWNYNGITVTGAVPQAVHATPLPDLLKQNGYYTIHTGKAHFGAIGYPTSNPEALGFDVNIGGHAAGAPGSYLGTENFGNGNEARAVWAVPGLEKYHGESIYLTQALTHEALDALQKPLANSQPFFLYFAPYSVHTPLMSDPRFEGHYTNPNMEPEEVRYASMIESMDHTLGQLLDFLDKKNIADNTIILFMSDNGGLSAVARGGEKHTHNAPLSSGKGSIHEGGIRVPMLVKWPGVSAPNTHSTHPVIIEDFFPTVLEMVGVEEFQTVQTVDGISFVNELKKPQTKASARPLYWHYPNDWGPEGPGIGSFSAIRQGDWKLIYYHENQHFELFNLKTDIGEEINRFESEPEHAKKLAKRLTDHLIGVAAQMPSYKESGEKVPWPIAVINK